MTYGIVSLLRKEGQVIPKQLVKYGSSIREESYYTAVTRETLDSLINKGYALTKFKNYWADDQKAYQGINTNLTCPNGMIFELQFHTPISYETKGEKTHVYYEIIRDENASEEEKEQARQKHDALFALIPVPDGVRDLSYDVSEQKQKGVVSAEEKSTE